MTPIFKRTLLSASVLSLLSGPVLAADENGLYQTLHFISCEAYIKDRKEPVNTGMNAVDMIYVSGWLSGYNYLTPNTYDIVPDHNIRTVMEWLDRFCKADPKKNIEAGLLKYTDDMYPKRIQLFKQPEAKAAPKPVKK